MGNFDIYVCLYLCMPPKPLPQSAVAIFLRDDAKLKGKRLFPEGGRREKRKARLAAKAEANGIKLSVNWHDAEVRAYLESGDYYDESGILMNDYCEEGKKIVRLSPKESGKNKKFKDQVTNTIWDSRLAYYVHLSNLAKSERPPPEKKGKKPAEESDDSPEPDDDVANPKHPRTEDVDSGPDDKKEDTESESDGEGKREGGKEGEGEEGEEEGDGEEDEEEGDGEEGEEEGDGEEDEEEGDGEEDEEEDAYEENAHEEEGQLKILIDIKPDLDLVVSADAEKRPMSYRTGRICCASLLRCYQSGLQVKIDHPKHIQAWTSDDEATPSMTNPFWANFSTIVLFDTQSRRIKCTLYPVKTAIIAKDGYARQYDDIRKIMISTPKTTVGMNLHIKLNGEVQWRMHNAEYSKLPDSDVRKFAHPTEFTFPGYMCRHFQDVSSFIVSGTYSGANRPPEFGWYLAQVEDIADDVYYHTDEQTGQQFKCFHWEHRWTIARVDTVGYYMPIFTSEELTLEAAPHPRHVQNWNAPDGMQVQISVPLPWSRGSRHFNARSQRAFETDVLPMGDDKSKRFSLLCYEGQYYMQKFQNDKTEYLKQDPGTRTTEGKYLHKWPQEVPRRLSSDTLNLIECMQEVVVFEVQSKIIIARLSWSDANSRFETENAILTSTDDFTWAFTAPPDKDGQVFDYTTLHRQLPVVGRGFHLCQTETEIPDLYCTHARNVGSFRLQKHNFDPVDKTKAGHQFQTTKHKLHMTRVSEDGTKYKWQMTGDSKINLHSKPFKPQELAYMHPIYADFETAGSDDDEETPSEETAKLNMEMKIMKESIETMKKEGSDLKKEKERESGPGKEKIDKELVKTLARLKRAQKDLADLEKRISDSIEGLKREAMIAAHARGNGQTEINHLRLNVATSERLIADATEARRLANIAAVAAREEAEVLKQQFANDWRGFFTTERGYMDGFVANARARDIEIAGHERNASLRLDEMGRHEQTANGRLDIMRQHEQTARQELARVVDMLGNIEIEGSEYLTLLRGRLVVAEQRVTDFTQRVTELEATLMQRVAVSTGLQAQYEAELLVVQQSNAALLAADAAVQLAAGRVAEIEGRMTELERQTSDEYRRLTQDAAVRLQAAGVERERAAGHEIALRLARTNAEAAATAADTAKSAAEAARTTALDAERDVVNIQRTMQQQVTETQTAAATAQANIAQAKAEVDAAAGQAKQAATEANDAKDFAMDHAREAGTAAHHASLHRVEAQSSRDLAITALTEAQGARDELRRVAGRAMQAQADAEAAHQEYLILIRQRTEALAAAPRDAEGLADAGTNDSLLNVRLQSLEEAIQNAHSSVVDSNEVAETAMTRLKSEYDGRIVELSQLKADITQDIHKKLVGVLQMYADNRDNIDVRVEEKVADMQTRVMEAFHVQERLQAQIERLLQEKGINVRDRRTTATSRPSTPPEGHAHEGESETGKINVNEKIIQPLETVYKYLQSKVEILKKMTHAQRRTWDIDSTVLEMNVAFDNVKAIFGEYKRMFDGIELNTGDMYVYKAMKDWYDGEITELFRFAKYLIDDEQELRKRNAIQDSNSRSGDAIEAVSRLIDTSDQAANDIAQDVANTGLQQAQDSTMDRVFQYYKNPSVRMRDSVNHVMQTQGTRLDLSEETQETLSRLMRRGSSSGLRPFTSSMLNCIQRMLQNIDTNDSEETKNTKMREIQQVLCNIRDVTDLSTLMIENGDRKNKRVAGDEAEGDADSRPPRSSKIQSRPLTAQKRQLADAQWSITESWQKGISAISDIWEAGADIFDPMDNLDNEVPASTAANEVLMDRQDWTANLPRMAVPIETDDIVDRQEFTAAARTDAKNMPIWKLQKRFIKSEIETITTARNKYTPSIKPAGIKECYEVLIDAAESELERVEGNIEKCKTNVRNAKATYSDNDPAVISLVQACNRKVTNPEQTAWIAAWVGSRTRLRKHVDKLQDIIGTEQKQWSATLRKIGNEIKDSVEMQAECKVNIFPIQAEISRLKSNLTKIEARSISMDGMYKLYKCILKYLTERLDAIELESQIPKNLYTLFEQNAWKLQFSKNPKGIASHFVTEGITTAKDLLEQRANEFVEDSMDVKKVLTGTFGHMIEHFQKLLTIDWKTKGQTWTAEAGEMMKSIEIKALDERESFDATEEHSAESTHDFYALPENPGPPSLVLNQWAQNAADIRAFTEYYNCFVPVAAQWNSKISPSNRGKINLLRENIIQTIRDHIATLYAEQDILKTNALSSFTPYIENILSRKDVNLEQIQEESNVRLRSFLELHPLVHHVLVFLQTPVQDISTKTFTKWEKEYKRLLALNRQAESDAAVTYSSDDTGPAARGKPDATKSHKKPDLAVTSTGAVGVNRVQLQAKIEMLENKKQIAETDFEKFKTEHPKPSKDAPSARRQVYTTAHNKLKKAIIAITKELGEQYMRRDQIDAKNQRASAAVERQANIFHLI